MTTPIADAEAEELERLERAATPGPWRVEANHERLSFNVVNWRDDWPDRPVAWLGANQADPCSDAELIAAMRNALPRLLAERRATALAVEAAREALETTAKRATVQELHELGVVVNFNDAADKEILAARAAIAALDGCAGGEVSR